MRKQKQIEEYEEEEKEEEIEKEDLKGFSNQINNMHKDINQMNYIVQEQDKRLVGVNDTLDKYNKKTKIGDDLTKVIDKGVFGMLKDKIVGIFSSKKDKKLSSKDRDILEKARNGNQNKKNENENLYFESKNDGWTAIKKDDIGSIKNKTSDKYDEDEEIEDSIKAVDAMMKGVKEFQKTIEDSKKVIDVVEKNMDIADENCKKVVKKLKKMNK